MMQDKYQTYASQGASRPASEIAAERREQIAADLAAMQERKDRDLVQQTSMESSPETRISLWERRHGLALPRSPQHPLLSFVATSTGLQMDQVIEEQARRAQRRAG
jgi:hypothetical protein